MATAFHLLRHRDDAADAVQETFLRAYRSLNTYDIDRRFAAWLSRIVVNVCISTLRARKSRPVAAEEERELGVADRSYQRTEQSMVLLDALNRLDTRDRAMLLLRHVHDLTSQEIGEIVHLPAATVRTRLARARETLRSVLPQAVDLYDPGETTVLARSIIYHGAEEATW
jgi:RNA polymerase sigma-70 factor (ECF subfamily)